MKGKIKIYIILVLIIGVLTGGFFIRQSYKKTEHKYKVCLEKCNILPRPETIFDAPRKTIFGTQEDKYSDYYYCVAECKEKYTK